MSDIITLENVSKDYRIHEKSEGFKNSFVNFFHRSYKLKRAISEVSFSIQKGEIVGLLGENGAGKTTLLKMLAGVLYPSSGKINVAGFCPTDRKMAFLKNIGFVMGNKAEINWNLPAIDSFRYQQLIYNIPEEEYQANLKLLSSLLGVSELLNTQIRRLSLGERMKMELINSFIYSPEIVFLDEPTIGLDLESQIAIRNFIKNYRKERQTTIIITSHYMDDIEETCDRIILLKQGRKMYDEAIEKIKCQDTIFKNTILNMMKEEVER